LVQLSPRHIWMRVRSRLGTRAVFLQPTRQLTDLKQARIVARTASQRLRPKMLRCAQPTRARLLRCRGPKHATHRSHRLMTQRVRPRPANSWEVRPAASGLQEPIRDEIIQPTRRALASGQAGAAHEADSPLKRFIQPSVKPVSVEVGTRNPDYLLSSSARSGPDP
jgi:hypothetical protein